MISKGILKDLVRNLIDFQKNFEGFGKDFNQLFKGFPIDLVGFKLISKGFGEEFHRFSKDFLLIW